MPYKDPAKQAAYQREWQRARRSVQPSPRRTVNPEDIRTASALLGLLSELLAELMACDLDLVTKSRTVGYLAGVALKATETAELERRLEDLETRILKGGSNGHRTQN